MAFFQGGVRHQIFVDAGRDPVPSQDLPDPVCVGCPDADIVDISVDLSFFAEIPGIQLGSAAACHYGFLQIVPCAYAGNPFLFQKIPDLCPGWSFFLKISIFFSNMTSSRS